MKIKKFLEKVAEEDRESLINEKDVEFLASIGVDYEKKRESAQKEPDSSYYLTASTFNYKALWAALAGIVLAALALTLSLYFTLRPSLVEPPIQYFEDNFVEAGSNLQELNAGLQLFSLTVDENEYEINVKRTYDSLSNDDLFFTLEFTAKQQGLSKNFIFDIVVNKFYTHKELTYTADFKEVKFEDNTLKYSEISRPMSGMPFVNVDIMGEMQIGEQWIYITRYEERALGQSTFIETLQSLITFI